MTDHTDSLPQAGDFAEPSFACETVDEPYESCALWERYHQRDIPFFKLTLMNRLVNRPYHAVTVEGPFQMKELTQAYQAQLFRTESALDQSGKRNPVRLLIRLDEDVFGYLEDDHLKFYAPTQQAAHAAALKARRFVKQPDNAKPSFFVISIDETGANTQSVEIERISPVKSADLALNYGHDFPLWEDQWLKRMMATGSGLSIFHGPPGCGKTSYLRGLVARLIDKAVFYFVPVSEVEMLSNPRFVSFWIMQTKRHPKKHKIVLLEDAEELLLPRDAGTRDKVSNLLNIADGFLGDHLKLHIIATTNATVRQLDPALLRPGRLMGTREFRRLTRSEAEDIARTKGLALVKQDDYSLAEIYCGSGAALTMGSGNPIGFSK